MITYAQFIADFPEFSNTTNFPQSSFNYYLHFASLMLTPVWGQPAPAGQPLTLYDIGTEMFVAHNLAIEALNMFGAAAGGIPGLIPGVVSGTVTGQVTTNYDVANGVNPDAGHWNLTTFGTRFVSMLRLLGAQPTQISPSGSHIPFSGPGWTGPNTAPGYFGS
jgi:Protein of unknown function (DUF4054)